MRKVVLCCKPRFVKVYPMPVRSSPNLSKKQMRLSLLSIIVKTNEPGIEGKSVDNSTDAI
jgi:hypothetical protein